MLLFRSEETVAEWCTERNLPVRPLVTLEQLWQLAQVWYGNRLTEESRRPTPDEMPAIFGRIGLADPFWDPKTP
jgi:hypothetical protein